MRHTYSVMSIEGHQLFQGALKDCLSFFIDNLSIVRKPLRRDVIAYWQEEYPNEEFPEEYATHL